MISNQKYYAGIYIRLSQEDRDKKYESESESVLNQRNILREYCRTNDYKIVEEYVDDGYSGTNFERPAFERMIKDIEQKKINLVVVKDLSRLGRDHVMTGYYMETFFPENMIRFISIMESYDSYKNQASNDVSTFIIASNDYYSKQNSIKIRNVLDSKRKEGKFIGSKPCYGYKRDPDDKGHLIVDDKVAYYVRLIFHWYSINIGMSEIATRLTEMKAPTPSAYKKIAYSSRLIDNDNWTISSIRKILQNRMYTGDMVQHVQTNINYKSKKKITLDSSRWIIVENTHQPLIDKETYNKINHKNVRTGRKESIRFKRELRLLEGLLYCKECGNRLTVAYRRNHNYWTINCNKYSRDPRRGKCSAHFFPYDLFEKQILEYVSNTVSKYIRKLNIEELNKIVREKINKIPTYNYEHTEINYEKEKEKIIKNLHTVYEDRLANVISKEQYIKFSEQYNNKLNEIENKIVATKKYKNKYKKNPEDYDYTNDIKRLLKLKNNRELLQKIIEEIVVDENRTIEIKFKEGLFESIKFQYLKK